MKKRIKERLCSENKYKTSIKVHTKTVKVHILKALCKLQISALRVAVC